MSIDTVFKPQGPTTIVIQLAVQVSTGGSGCTSFRVRNLATVPQYFAWGKTAAAAIASIGLTPPGAAGAQNTIGMLPNSVETFEIPTDSFIIAGAAAGFEFTAGQGS